MLIRLEVLFVFHTNPWRSHFLLSPSLGPDMTSLGLHLYCLSEDSELPSSVVYVTVKKEREDLIDAYLTNAVLQTPPVP